MPSPINTQPVIEIPRQESHGDFSTNIAMVSASIQKMAPAKIASILVDHMEDSETIIEKTQIAGPGFINFHLTPDVWFDKLKAIHAQKEQYGSSNLGKKESIQVEFVSSNPTGPLHIGHGRCAAVGDSISNILAFCGYDVQKEYYINDSGRQIQTLGRSVFLRYCELLGQTVDYPKDCYQGGYIRELAREEINEKSDSLLNIKMDDAISVCAKKAANRILEGIETDLKAFRVSFHNWFSEQSLYDSGKIVDTFKWARENDFAYDKDGAIWFRTKGWGDEKDRVIRKQDGQNTYFASDIAYHKDKFDRGFTHLIDVWGADHHGYIERLSAAIESFGKKREQFSVVLVQLVNLMRNGQPVAMSTRAGEFVTLKDVVDEVGADACRFSFLMRHHDSPLDFDLEIAKKKTNDNPVYYVQYVHARISSIIKKSQLESIESCESLSSLNNSHELRLIKSLAEFPEVVEASAQKLEPHRIAYYLTQLAALFHNYYNNNRVLSDDEIVTHARLYLVNAVQIVIRNGLSLLGVTAPESM
ncbi:MAG: arginyl-tRNA synthetase [Candidatus Magnetoglobus multicellularis str. Araruama]|uniref:Arginine--tRNA ligase n=1 Tax=Candidatus Magnetoglobus multicellularis str. Araruama TaxID=890399 RepID=A0A1V1P4W8_9BACT|nr:MAG: arginyl-tRNA synthetase [Candidatus Magnetoglobus multicellularis str. Araruama]